MPTHWNHLHLRMEYVAFVQCRSTRTVLIWVSVILQYWHHQLIHLPGVSLNSKSPDASQVDVVIWIACRTIPYLSDTTWPDTRMHSFVHMYSWAASDGRVWRSDSNATAANRRSRKCLDVSRMKVPALPKTRLNLTMLRFDTASLQAPWSPR